MVYHHRGAYLNALCMCFHGGVQPHAVYLWTVPMFHCNGWCMAWGIAAAAGTSVCLRKVDAERVFALIKAHRVTNYGGAPIVHTTLINANPAWRAGIDWPITAMIAGAAPPRATIEGMEGMGVAIAHVYGLTETYGPATICAVQDEWSGLDVGHRAERLGRQGVRFLAEEGLTVMNPATMTPVPADGETMGEVMFRGNLTMKGYLKNPRATAEAFAGGWFHSGDLAVRHPDGYVKVKDRSKDIIISGGENISSLEVEDALSRHPAVLVSAVVAMPDKKWGETPCAFVELKDGATATEQEGSSTIAGPTSRTTRRRGTSSSVRSRRPRPGRSRSTSCASASSRRWRSSDAHGPARCDTRSPTIMTTNTNVAAEALVLVERARRRGDDDAEPSGPVQRPLGGAHRRICRRRSTASRRIAACGWSCSRRTGAASARVTT